MLTWEITLPDDYRLHLLDICPNQPDTLFFTVGGHRRLDDVDPKRQTGGTEAA